MSSIKKEPNDVCLTGLVFASSFLLLFLCSGNEGVNDEGDYHDINCPFVCPIAEGVVQHLSDWVEVEGKKQRSN